MKSVPHHRPTFTSPVIDCEPPPAGTTRHIPSPTSAPHRRRPAHRHPPAVAGEVPAPTAAAVFADAALRRVLEVLDRRRPAGQLRNVLAPALVDTAQSLARVPQAGGAAVLRRIRLRSITADTGQPVTAAEVFATYTRGARVRAIAARVEIVAGRWQMVALQVG